MDETEKRIRSWGFQGQCQLLQRGGKIVDVGTSAHLSVPHARGIHIVFGDEQPHIEAALRAAKILQKSCFGVEKRRGPTASWIGRECPFLNECRPEKAAVQGEEGKWKPAVRPRHQRP